jgi:hypothetical protein
MKFKFVVKFKKYQIFSDFYHDAKTRVLHMVSDFKKVISVTHAEEHLQIS